MMRSGRLRRRLVLPALLLLSVLSFSGCLDPAPEPAGQQEVARGTVEVPELDFEGTGCVGDNFLFFAPADRLSPHLPERFRSDGPAYGVRTITYSCEEGSLGNASREGVRLMTFDLVVDDAEAGGITQYLVEAATDWPDLHEALAATGANARLADFTRTVDAAGNLELTVEAEGLSYTFLRPGDPPMEGAAAQGSTRLLVGPDGRRALGYDHDTSEQYLLYYGGTITARGGALGDVAGDALASFYLESAESIRIHGPLE